MPRSRIEIHIDITFFDGLSKGADAEFLQHLYLFIRKILFPFFFLCSGLHIETIQKFSACLMFEVIKTPIWLR